MRQYQLGDTVPGLRALCIPALGVLVVGDKINSAAPAGLQFDAYSFEPVCVERRKQILNRRELNPGAFHPPNESETP